jgi:hypothetical protein
MNNDKIEILLKRINNLDLIKNLDVNPFLTVTEVNNVERELQLTLPNDFKRICSYCSYEFLGGFEFYSFDIGVIKKNLEFRKNYNLPNNYIVLVQEDDVAFILLKTISTEKSEVIWCDYQDFFNLCDGEPMVYNPTIFPSFTDFYEFLLDEEEKSRAENAGR